MLNFRFKITVGTFGQSFGPPSLLLGQCPKFDLFSIWQPSLNDVILKRNDTNLSKQQAYILPNLNESIKPGELISNNTLYQALNATPESEYWNVHEKHYKYTHHINWADYAKPDQLFSSEKNSSWPVCSTTQMMR